MVEKQSLNHNAREMLKEAQIMQALTQKNIPAIIGQKCSSSRKLLLFGHCSSSYCFRARGIVSVVCCIVHSKGIEPLV